MLLQVRAAAVFALGTYIMNVPEEGPSDLSISIDHSVGTRLLSLVNDGSPIVRRVSLRIHRHTMQVLSCVGLIGGGVRTSWACGNL